MDFGFDWDYFFCSVVAGWKRDFFEKHLQPDVKVLVVKSCFMQRVGDAYLRSDLYDVETTLDK